MSQQYLQELFGLNGKTAVVIGGTGVLGGAIAEGLARAGANVVVAGRSVERGDQRVKAIESLGGRAAFVEVDATSRASLETLLAATLEKFGTADILVNCAGVNKADDYFEVKPEDFDRILAGNLTATHLGCQVFSRQMVDAGGGAILNIGSVSAGVPLSRVYAYSASKAAVVNLTKNIARELAPHGVRVNALSPGFIPAEQNRKILTTERVENIMRHTPMKRFGEPHELIGAVLLLVSPAAGSFITGADYYVDGGFTAMTI